MHDFFILLKHNFITFSVLSSVLIIDIYIIHSFLKSGKGKFRSFEFLLIVFFLIVYACIFIIEKKFFYAICDIAVLTVQEFPQQIVNSQPIVLKMMIFFNYLVILTHLYFKYTTSIYTINISFFFLRNNSLLFLKDYSKLIFIRKFIFESLFNFIFLPILKIIFFYSIFIIPLMLFLDFLNYLDWFYFFEGKCLFNRNLQINLNRFVLIQMDFENIEHLQTWMVDYALHSMRTNEFLFEFHPNTTSFQNYKINYQKSLKSCLRLVESLEWRFENPDEALRFISAAYEHYFKIIEFNQDSTIS